MKISILAFSAAILILSGMWFNQFTGKDVSGVSLETETKQLENTSNARLEGNFVERSHDGYYTFWLPFPPPAKDTRSSLREESWEQIINPLYPSDTEKSMKGTEL